MATRRWAMLLGALAACGLAACGDDGPAVDAAVPPPPGAGIYVSGLGGRITVLPLGATGEAEPLRTITGPSTGLELPVGIDVDSRGNLYVANRVGATVTVYGPDATGDAAPIRTLTAPELGAPQAVAIGLDDEVFVAACPACGSSSGGVAGIYHFTPDADVGDGVIGGGQNAQAGVRMPAALVFNHARGEVVASNALGGRVVTHPRDARGDILPLRTFDPGAENVQGLGVGADTIFLVDPSLGLLQFALGATGTPTGSVMPLEVEYPGGVWLDTAVSPPDLYVVDYLAEVVQILHLTGEAPAFTVGAVDVLSGPGTAGALVVRVVH